MFLLETYGCQMNKYDSELVAGILETRGLLQTDSLEEAEVVIVNTCAVRAHAEQRAIGRIQVLGGWKKAVPGRRLGVIGCMAQRLGEQILEQCPSVDFVLGPDDYRFLPDLIDPQSEQDPVRTTLGDSETYSGIRPVRQSGISGWIAVMRGCDNFCAYCIVPYTRGRERSRPVSAVVEETARMAQSGFREITLLGQNVNSYHDGDTDFPALLQQVSRIDRRIWIRFMTSHPKDLSNRLLEVIAEEPNVCPHIHLPAQSGSTEVLRAMNRQYTREMFMERIAQARQRIPGVALTTDILVGFPEESERAFRQTCTLLETVRFEDAYLYHYSPREGTASAKIPETLTRDEKLKRLDEVIRIQRRISGEIRQSLVGTQQTVMPEGRSRKSQEEWLGKTPEARMVVFRGETVTPGDPVTVQIEGVSGATLRGVSLTP